MKICEHGVTLNYPCKKCAENETTGNKPASVTGLCALQKLSDQWRGEAAQRLVPPQDEFDIPKYEVAETLLYCADELDRVIKEIST